MSSHHDRRQSRLEYTPPSDCDGEVSSLGVTSKAVFDAAEVTGGMKVRFIEYLFSPELHLEDDAM